MSPLGRLPRVQFLDALWQSAVFWLSGLRRRLWHAFGCQPKPSSGEVKRPYSRRIQYEAIPGSWQRRLHPDWPEARFQIPADVPLGTVYYVTKGEFLGSPEGHVVKSPKPNPYSPRDEEANRQDLRVEAEVYRRLGPCRRVPKMLRWDPASCCLTMEFMQNGCLQSYMQARGQPEEGQSSDIDETVRRRWTVQAAEAMAVLHAVGVVHSDFVPRNLLLDADLNLYISDFAGSSVDGSVSTVCGGPRYMPSWKFDKPPTEADDLFALGSVLFFIATGEDPYAEKSVDKILQLFDDKQFPETSEIFCGPATRGCWQGTLITAAEVLDSLGTLYGGVAYA